MTETALPDTQVAHHCAETKMPLFCPLTRVCLKGIILAWILFWISLLQFVPYHFVLRQHQNCRQRPQSQNCGTRLSVPTSGDIDLSGALCNLLIQEHFQTKKIKNHLILMSSPRNVVSRNQSQGICSQTSISLTHVTKVIGFGKANLNLWDKYKHQEIKADNEHEISGVRNLGISSNDYLIWLVHKPADDQVSYVLKVQPHYIHS